MIKKHTSATNKEVENQSYFEDSINWYNIKYLQPFTQRSYVALALIFTVIAIFSLSANIYLLFPIQKTLYYAVHADETDKSDVKLIQPNSFSEDPIKSLVAALVENYIKIREEYDYDKLQEQFLYVKNNSTRFIYTAFYNSMDLNNSKSPILNYRRDLVRKITILSTKFINDSNIEIDFKADVYAKGNLYKSLGSSTWKANLKITIDDLNNRLALSGKFNFSVINYVLNELNQ